MDARQGRASTFKIEPITGGAGMWGFKGGVGAVLRAGTAAAVLALCLAGAARSDGDPAEQGLTKREYDKVAEIAPPPDNEEEVAAPVHAHNLNDAERAEMERMHAVRILKGKEW